MLLVFVSMYLKGVVTNHRVKYKLFQLFPREENFYKREVFADITQATWKSLVTPYSELFSSVFFRIRTEYGNTEYLSVFSRDAEKCGPE